MFVDAEQQGSLSVLFHASFALFPTEFVPNRWTHKTAPLQNTTATLVDPNSVLEEGVQCFMMSNRQIMKYHCNT